MKPKSVSILLSVLVLAVIGLSLISTPVAAIGSWTATTSYPETAAGQSCVSHGSYIYCVGSVNGTTSHPYTNAVRFASVSRTGVGRWMVTTSYPTTIYDESCVASGDYIYCVAGYTGRGSTNVVYFAKLSPSGVGAWALGPPYPISIYDESCVTSGGYIYCVGGIFNGGMPATNIVYFASLSPAIGSWVSTGNYPTNIGAQSCVVSGGYIYCVGGDTAAPAPPNSVTGAVYSAKLSSSGVGLWVKGTDYPTPISYESCVVAQYTTPQVYCVGGSTGVYPGVTNAVYFAPVSGTGIGAWTPTTGYPTNIDLESCVYGGGYIYCVGGAINGVFEDASAVYFAHVHGF